MLKTDGKFSERFVELCDRYDDPPIPQGISMTRVNSLLKGSRKPTLDELVAISTTFNVSINYLLTGDEMFPGLYWLKRAERQRILDEIYDLEEEPDF